MTIRFSALAGAATALLLLTACGEETADDPLEDSLEQPVEQETDTAADGDAPSGGNGDYLDELYADSLHDGITPAEPGTAYVEVGGERIDFEEVVCTVRDDPEAEKFRIDATADTEGVGHMMYIDREIGENIGFNWEDELVQLALLTTAADEDTRAQYSNSLLKIKREPGGDPEWDDGEGASPAIRVVGDQATATGAFGSVMFADAPLDGDFIAAATCP